MSQPVKLLYESHLWGKFIKNKMAVACSIIVLFLVFACFIGPIISPYKQIEQDLYLGATGISKAHWLGTDGLGRDLLTRILYGGRVSLGIAFLSTVVSVFIGVIYGTSAAYLGGIWDRLLMRIVDIITALPYIFLVIIFMAFLGKGLISLVWAIVVVGWLTTARIVRSLVLGLKEQDFVSAAHIMGQSVLGIFFKHILPNIASVVIICASITVPQIIMLESLLSFLGIGVLPPAISWGGLIRNGVNAMEEFPQALLFPSLFFLITLFCLNFIGDALSSCLNTKDYDQVH